LRVLPHQPKVLLQRYRKGKHQKAISLIAGCSGLATNSTPYWHLALMPPALVAIKTITIQVDDGELAQK